jgi:Family of unknown function (DUF6573)
VDALTRREALGLADRLSAAALDAADPDTAGVLVDLVADLVNHASGHRVPWLAARKEAAAAAAGPGLYRGALVTVPSGAGRWSSSRSRGTAGGSPTPRAASATPARPSWCRSTALPPPPAPPELKENRLVELDMPLIHSRTRAEMLADGGLVAVPQETAAEAGLGLPLAVTRAVWEDCVAWGQPDNDRKGTLQDEAGRLWDVVWMASRAARRNRGGDRAPFTVLRVPRPGRGRKPREVSLVLAVGPGDGGEPVLTVTRPGED